MSRWGRIAGVSVVGLILSYRSSKDTRENPSAGIKQRRSRRGSRKAGFVAAVSHLALIVTAPKNVCNNQFAHNSCYACRWQQQFAAVSGSTNTGVTWAVTQGAGTITQSGLYTAPQVAEIDLVTGSRILPRLQASSPEDTTTVLRWQHWRIRYSN
jgi:hypothetical protein